MASDVMKTNNDAYGREGAQKDKDLRVTKIKGESVQLQNSARHANAGREALKKQDQIRYGNNLIILRL